MKISEPQSNTSEADREHLIQAFKDWRPGKISERLVLRNAHARPSAIRRVFRTITLGFLAVLAALALVAWQSPRNEVKNLARVLGSQLSRFTAGHDASATATVSTKTVTENTAASQSAPPASASQPTEQEYTELKRQIDAVSGELTDVRGIAEQLIANQKQMGEDLAALRASEESLKQKLLSASPHSAAPTAALKKKVTVHPRKGVTGQSPSEHLSIGAPLPLH